VREEVGALVTTSFSDAELTHAPLKEDRSNLISERLFETFLAFSSTFVPLFWVTLAESTNES
jgi:hypothetical protein